MAVGCLRTHDPPQQANRYSRRFAGDQSGSFRRRIRLSATVVILLAAITVAGGAATPEDGCRPELVVGPELEVVATETAFYLRVTGSLDCLPPGSHVYVSGLAPSAELSIASKMAPGSWVIPLWALENLKIRVPAGFVGSSNFSIKLFDGAGRMLSKRAIVLYAKAPVIGASTESEADPVQSKQVEITPPAAPEMPVSAVRASPTQAELARAKRMLGQGEQFLAQGNVVIAREYLRRAAALGSGVAALRLGETHDPLELRHLKILGLKQDPVEARRWYERAVELGADGAEAKLRRLGTR